jgi:hypothetical protein
MVLEQPASPPPPVVPPPLVPPAVPVPPALVPPPLDSPIVEPPLERPPLPFEDPAVDELPPPVDPAVAVADPVFVADPPVVHVVWLYWQSPSLHMPFGQSLPESQSKSTHAGGSVGQPASRKATTTRGSDFTM